MGEKIHNPRQIFIKWTSQSKKKSNSPKKAVLLASRVVPNSYFISGHK